jgi:hypothetical protein
MDYIMSSVQYICCPTYSARAAGALLIALTPASELRENSWLLAYVGESEDSVDAGMAFWR